MMIAVEISTLNPSSPLNAPMTKRIYTAAGTRTFRRYRPTTFEGEREVTDIKASHR